MGLMCVGLLSCALTSFELDTFGTADAAIGALLASPWAARLERLTLLGDFIWCFGGELLAALDTLASGVHAPRLRALTIHSDWFHDPQHLAQFLASPVASALTSLDIHLGGGARRDAEGTSLLLGALTAAQLPRLTHLTLHPMPEAKLTCGLVRGLAGAPRAAQLELLLIASWHRGDVTQGYRGLLADRGGPFGPLLRRGTVVESFADLSESYVVIVDNDDYSGRREHCGC